ncbi:MAG: hypothetical protein RL088_704 [Verrucomicrobiota bacterium]|jgi:hypothetical protein
MKLPFFLSALVAVSAFAQNEPPAGFTALFNGKDLTGWRGGDTADHRAYPALPDDKKKAWTDDMLKHWKVEGGELLNDGHGKYATTEKEYGNFELLVEYNMAPKGDSGIYLRNVPQVQIWDHTDDDKGALGRTKGSGGLWNNSPGAPGKDPLVLADKPAGEWNKFRIVMVGQRVSVWLNEKMVVDHAILENYYDRKKPVPAKGPICLQTHGAPIKWRNVFIREIGSEESNKILASKGGEGFESVWNGKDFTGWAGPVENYEVVDGAIVCKKGKGGTIYTKDEYSDFVVRLEFKLPPNGNNGLAIRYPGEGDTAYVGMMESQILADDYKGIDPRQAHGSAYGMIAAERGYQHPIGEWNFHEVTIKGSTVRVETNGSVILNGDLSKVTEFMGGKAHPGMNRTSGFFGFAGHSDPVMYRNISIKKLK